MTRIQLEDLNGESLEEIKQGEEDSRKRDELRRLGLAEIIDLLPSKRENQLLEDLIDEIIEEGWYNE